MWKSTRAMSADYDILKVTNFRLTLFLCQLVFETMTDEDSYVNY